MTNLNNLKKNIQNFKKNIDLLNQNKSLMAAYNSTIKLLLGSINKGGKIIFMGNGGSAADAQHLNAELVGKFLKKRKAIPSISLTTDTSVITSISNDVNYKFIFSRQIESIAKKNDIIFGITTSGKSKNIIEGFKKAKNIKCKTVCLTKHNYPKNLNNLCDIIIPVNADRVDRIQELHIFIGHNICEILEKKIM